MCHFWDPIFSPKSPLQSISFSQITEKSRSGASPFYSFCRSGDHHFQNSIFKPFRRRPRPVYCGQRSGVIADQNAARRVLQSAPRRPPISRASPLQRPTFSRSSPLAPAPETSIFTLKPLQSPTFFTSPWHIPTKMWVECPPPPRGGWELEHETN